MPDYLTYRDAEAACSAAYLWNAVTRDMANRITPGSTVFDLGCGNGAFARELSRRGYIVSGVDTSSSGIEHAQRESPELELKVGSAYDDLPSRFGQFHCVVSLEVVEHCYYPRAFAKTVYDLLLPGGLAIISTPYHGYLKNLAISILGQWDTHWSPLWDGGHIKFFSRKTLGTLLEEHGFQLDAIRRVGRVGPLSKSMVALATRPSV